jgi:deoxycytidylate deaminase
VTPEIVIALCGPLGTRLHFVATVLKKLLEEEHRYELVSILRLSDFIREHGHPADPHAIEALIDAGNNLRESFGASVLAQLAIQQITLDRAKTEPPIEPSAQISLDGLEQGVREVVRPTPVVRYCHIIDSIKNAEELKLLRMVYGSMLHVVSVNMPIASRVRQLTGRFPGVSTADLIDRDSGEEVRHGQSVRDVFPLADFFLRDEDADDRVESQLRRYLGLMLGTRIMTPTNGERAMYAAHSAAKNSACLSRQVGAALINDGGDVLSVGWNDVPQASGGLYQTGQAYDASAADHRCWNKSGGTCFNDAEKTKMSHQLAAVLAGEGIIDAAKVDEVAGKLRRSSEVSNLIEFSRAVHAEMHALLNAGQGGGNQVQGAHLYVTTYPCHSCARHIIAAGVEEVRYIEPYRKSLATRLHDDALTEDETDVTKVRVLPFEGVAPTRFQQLFSTVPGGRKDKDGKMTLGRLSAPVTAETLEAIKTLESIALKELESKGLLLKSKPVEG